MLDELIAASKKYSGNVITIGFNEDSKLIKCLKRSNKITQVFSLVRRDKLLNNKKKKRFSLSQKRFNTKKIRRAFKNTVIDYEICNFEDTRYILGHFIPNSILLVKREIVYYVSDDEYDFEELMYRFERFGCLVSAKGYKGYHIVTIDPSGVEKIGWFKRFFYNLRDVSYNVNEFIAAILMS